MSYTKCLYTKFGIISNNIRENIRRAFMIDIHCIIIFFSITIESVYHLTPTNNNNNQSINEHTGITKHQNSTINLSFLLGFRSIYKKVSDDRCS